MRIYCTTLVRTSGNNTSTCGHKETLTLELIFKQKAQGYSSY